MSQLTTHNARQKLGGAHVSPSRQRSELPTEIIATAQKKGFHPSSHGPPTNPGALRASSPGQRLPGHALSSPPSPHAPAPSTSHGSRVLGSLSLVFLRGLLHKAQRGRSGQVPRQRRGLRGEACPPLGDSESSRKTDLRPLSPTASSRTSVTFSSSCKDYPFPKTRKGKPLKTSPGRHTSETTLEILLHSQKWLSSSR